MSDKPISKVKLKDPIKYGEKEVIEELDFRAPTGADLEDYPVNGATIGDYMRIAARLTETPPSALKMASGRDCFTIAAAVESQLAGGPPTGGT